MTFCPRSLGSFFTYLFLKVKQARRGWHSTHLLCQSWQVSFTLWQLYHLQSAFSRARRAYYWQLAWRLLACLYCCSHLCLQKKGLFEGSGDNWFTRLSLQSFRKAPRRTAYYHGKLPLPCKQEGNFPGLMKPPISYSIIQAPCGVLCTGDACHQSRQHRT